jgi:hypothetical protein
MNLFKIIEQQSILLISMGICLLSSCGDDESLTPTIIKDITPPTITGTNVQGGPIPVNTPIVLVFNEKVNLTSAQRGITVRSSIDAELIKGVITLEQKGHEVKFTPIGKMTTGAYVLTVLGIEDIEGNILMTPFSIFFSAVEIDTTQTPADVIPPTVISTVPAAGQSVKTTGSLVVRFDEEIDISSAQAGIVVFGVEAVVKVSGAVAIFQPINPIKAGRYTLTIIGIRDLTGNIMESSHVVPFEVIAPVVEKVEPPPTVVPTGGRGRSIFWESGKFIKKKGNSIKVYKTGFKAKGNPDENVKDFVIAQASNGSFVGQDNGVAADGSWLKYEFSLPVGGDWYLWGKVIAPSVADNSFHWGIDIADGDAKNADDDNCNIWDFFEKEELRKNYSTNWIWFRLNSRSGNPFPGQELDQYGPNPTPVELAAGKHTFHLIDREDGTFIDAFFATTDKRFDVNKAGHRARLAVETEISLPTVWGGLKSLK